MSRTKTPVQVAIVQLRRQLNLTQQQLAVAMNVTSVSVARWETSRSPSGYSLIRLQEFAANLGKQQLASVFADALWAETGRTPGGIIRSGPVRGPEPAIISAIREIRESMDVSQIRRRYLKILQAVEACHAVLVERARKEGIGKDALAAVESTHDGLEWEIEDEQTKER